MLDYVSDLVEMVFLKLLKNVTIDQIIMEKIIFVIKIVETSILTNFVEMVIEMKMNEKNVMIDYIIDTTENVHLNVKKPQQFVEMENQNEMKNVMIETLTELQKVQINVAKNVQN